MSCWGCSLSWLQTANQPRQGARFGLLLEKQDSVAMRWDQIHPLRLWRLIRAHPVLGDPDTEAPPCDALTARVPITGWPCRGAGGRNGVVRGWKSFLGSSLPRWLQEVFAVTTLLFVRFIAVSMRGTCSKVGSKGSSGCVVALHSASGDFFLFLLANHLQTDWFSSILLLRSELFTELSFGLRLLCISSTQNQLFVKFKIQNTLIGHVALQEWLLWFSLLLGGHFKWAPAGICLGPGFSQYFP